MSDKSPWISVKDALPGRSIRRVLCAIVVPAHKDPISNAYDTPRQVKEIFYGNWSQGDFWDGFDPRKGEGIRDVTHWMPIPPLPEGD